MQRSPTRGDYGLYAPYVIRNLTLMGLGLLLIGLVCLYALEGRLAHAIGYLCLGSFAVGSLQAGYVIWSSRVGGFYERERLVDLVRLQGHERVLDVGCGRGLILNAAVRRLTTGNAIGIDIWNARDQSGNHPDVTRRNAAIEGVADRVEVMDGDARSIPFPDGHFDVVLTSLVIHNLNRLEDRRRALCEMFRVLKPGGRLAILDFRNIREYADTLRKLGASHVQVIGPHFTMYPPVWILLAQKP
jgi:SAM-dependent methyltransferase